MLYGYHVTGVAAVACIMTRECRLTKVCGKRAKWESFDECYASDIRERIDCVWSSLMSAFHVYRTMRKRLNDTMEKHCGEVVRSDIHTHE